MTLNLWVIKATQTCNKLLVENQMNFFENNEILWKKVLTNPKNDGKMGLKWDAPWVGV